MDRHRRHLAVRQRRLQSGGRAHRRGRATATSAPSRSGTSASSRTSTTRSSSAPATSSWRCGGLRKFARTGAPDELDLDGTIKGTAHKGYLDILMRPERHNSVKVLLFFDIGGSMDWHIKATEELFSAARTEFKHMEHFYFHNCLYEKVWKENRRQIPGDHADLAGAAHLSARLQDDLRRRRLDVAVRDLIARRLGRALQRGGGRDLDGARHAHLSGLRLAQPGAGEASGSTPIRSA